MTANRAEASGDRFVEVDRVRVRVRAAGEGQPLLLIMGVGGNLEMWHPFDRQLNAHGIHTISFDAPGTGASGELDRPRRMPWLARMVEHLLEQLGHEQVDVLGVSWGGALAQQIAHQSPQRVRRLVLAATAPGAPGFGGVPGHPRVLTKLANPRRHHDPDYLAGVADELYGGRRQRSPRSTSRHGRASPRPREDTGTRSGPHRAGQPCRGCAGSSSRRSSSPAMTTRWFRWPTDESWPASYRTRA